MENNDIVARLREIPNGIGGYFYKTTQQAAAEIERLRNDLDGAQLAYRGASYDRDRMRSERDALCEALWEISQMEDEPYSAEFAADTLHHVRLARKA